MKNFRPPFYRSLSIFSLISPSLWPKSHSSWVQHPSSWHNHMEGMIPTYPALHLFSWQGLHYCLQSLHFLKFKSHNTVMRWKLIWCWHANEERRRNTWNTFFFFFVPVKNFNTICESLEMLAVAFLLIFIH